MRDCLKHLVFEALMKNIKKIFDIEKNLPDQDRNNKMKFFKEWRSIECALR